MSAAAVAGDQDDRDHPWFVACPDISTDEIDALDTAVPAVHDDAHSDTVRVLVLAAYRAGRRARSAEEMAAQRVRTERHTRRTERARYIDAHSEKL